MHVDLWMSDFETVSGESVLSEIGMGKEKVGSTDLSNIGFGVVSYWASTGPM